MTAAPTAPPQNYPTPSDYIAAVQRPATAFRVPALQQARFAAAPPFHIPTPASGTAAVVFRAEVQGSDQALRFFTRARMSSRQRYAALGHHLAAHQLAENAAAARWVDDAITVRGQAWPMVQMDWVDGRTLDAYVADLAAAGDRVALRTLADQWRDLVARMQRAGFAHGDLQHGNVLFDQSLRLRMVDFDSAWIEDLSGQIPPSETGHRNYQRADREWGRWMDTFPALVVYASLIALAERPTLWSRRHDGDNLLFTDSDFSAPFDSDRWRELATLADPHTGYALARLRDCCQPGWRALGSLESLLDRAPTISSGAPPVPVITDGVGWAFATETQPPGPAPSGALPKPTPVTAVERPTADSTSLQPGGTGWEFQVGPVPSPVQSGSTTKAPQPQREGRSPALSVLIAAVVGVVLALLVNAASDGEAGGGAVVLGLLAAMVVAAILLLRNRRPPD